MLLASGFASTSDIVFLFAAAGIVLYVASRAGADALTPLTDPSPGRLALAQWLPIAWTALLATLAGHSEIGVGIAFATSIAALAMVLGILLCMAPLGSASLTPSGAPTVHTSAWPFVVPGAIFALLAGFGGTLGWWHALMLLAIGVCVLSVWRVRGGQGNPTMVTAAPTPMPVPALPLDDAERFRTLQFLLSLLLGAAGAWLAYKAITITDQRTRVATTGLIAMAVVSPLLALPMLGTGAIAAHNARGGAATAAIVGVVLLNLCLLLPLVVLGHYAHQLALAWLAGARTIQALRESYPRPMPFPLAVWRVDSVLLIVLGLMLIPVSLGRWPLRRIEGLALVFLYAAYLILSTAIAIKI